MSTGVLQQSNDPVRSVTAGQDAILLLAPQIYAHGGVQSYMRRLATIITAYCGAFGRTCIPLALGRRSLRELDGANGTAVPVVDACGSKPKLVANAFATALRTPTQLAVVGHTGLGPVALAMKSCSLIRSYIVVLHGIEAWQQLSLADRIAARGASYAIATTEFTARTFAAANDYPLNRILVVPLSIGEDRIAGAVVPAPTCGVLRVLTVGRLAVSERYKGVDYLIDAIAALNQLGIAITLEVVGDGDDAPTLKRRAAASGASQAVRFHGAVSDDRLQDLYRTCDVFAMPSLNEGFGIVFLEAMQFGKPCIGGNHGGTPEIIEDGVNGFLVRHGDVDQLIDRLRVLHADRDRLRTMGERAHRTVSEKYRLGRMKSDWFGVLETALNDSQTAVR